MRIVILGGGPAGLYCALLIKKAHPDYDITLLERNPADVTYGWGVVFSDRTLSSFQRADAKTYEQISEHFVIWDAIDVHYRDETIRCGGHIIASIARKHLLNILQRRCAELGIALHFNSEIQAITDIPACDLLIAADGINSIVRKHYASFFQPSIETGKARYIWLGTDKVLDAFTFLFRENEHGLFQVHAYPSSGSSSTFIVECDESSWLKAGLDRASEQESISYCEHLFAPDLAGASLLSNNSRWINFPTLKTHTWHHQHIVLLGDAVHTAHFSIGSGTKLAMEDAIALANALEQHSSLETALNEYELERKPVVETFQRAARESQTYFETIKRYLALEPMQFAFQLLTRSGRISYDDLRLRDPRFGDTIDRWYAQHACNETPVRIAPPPLFAPLRLREMTLPNRLALRQKNIWQPVGAEVEKSGEETLASPNPPIQTIQNETGDASIPSGIALLITEPVAISVEARITPQTLGLYTADQFSYWTRIVEQVHSQSTTKIALTLCHAGRRGSTRPRSEGLDRPLRDGNWPLISASPLPYTAQSQIPVEMDRTMMERLCQNFVRAAQMAHEAGFDMIQLHMAHGYLLASFLSPLSNQRSDMYGGSIEARMRFPLEVFDAIHAAWPQEKPLAVALSASDYVKGGYTIEDALVVARTLKAHGCDMIEVLAGQTTPTGEPPYGRGFLTPLSDRIRNEAGIPTLVGGYLTTGNEINTILAAGRADMCIVEGN